jgi:hypothetical protein
MVQQLKLMDLQQLSLAVVVVEDQQVQLKQVELVELVVVVMEYKVQQVEHQRQLQEIQEQPTLAVVEVAVEMTVMVAVVDQA